AQVRAQYERFFEALAPMQANRTIPVAFAPGNHDIMGIPANESIFTEYFEHLYFSFDAGGCHFIVLNTDGAHSSGMIDDHQLQWLRRDLLVHRAARFTFVVMHQPLFPVDGHVGSSLDVHPERRDALHELFVQSGVDSVFAGHEHLYNHQERDGVHYFITGGAGAPLYAPPERGGFYHYLLVQVEDDRYRVTVRRVTMTGEG
ncbi:MAG: metallophosphoesterase, partial [Armatimonadetes bacterium]|nr:metallophosphoesterase [Armatimonadota bacterium]